MSFYKFKPEDIIYTEILTYPSYISELNGDQVTGSVYLENPYLLSSFNNRLYSAFSEKEGADMVKYGPFTASIDIIDAESGGTNKEFYQSLLTLYDYYSLYNDDYTPQYTGSDTSRFRVITIPEIYFDRQIATGTFVAVDLDNADDERVLYDNGRGGIFSGSISGTLVGNIFYSEGLVVLKGGGLNDEVASNDFGQASTVNFKWRISFEGTNKIPVKIFRCRAPAGQLNASTNPTYCHVDTSTNASHRNEKEIILERPTTYITSLGLYNEHFELVGYATLAQPIKKEESNDLMIKLKWDS